MVALKESQKQKRRAQIIEGAIKIFARKGFYHATVKDVAREAGVADGTIYLYFKNKDDLLISLFESKMEDILSRFRSRLANFDDPLERLREFIRVYFELIEEDIELSDVFQVELRQSSKFLKDYHNEKFMEYMDIIASIIEEGKSIGFFRKSLDTNLTKLLVFGAIDEVARQWILSNGKYSLKEAGKATAYTLIHGLLATS